MKGTLIALGCLAALAIGSRPVAAQIPDGQALFRENCRTCHGNTGKPTMGAASLYKNIPTFTAAFFSGRSQDSVVAVLKRGAGTDMKSFKDKLTPEEIQAVATYVRTTLVGAAGK